MAYPRLSVRKIKEILRLYYELGLSKTKIAQSVNQSRASVRQCIERDGCGAVQKAGERGKSRLTRSALA
ncbi:MAG: hypothetical protein M3Q07_05505 [Pseudobdellovibrionaceae bacterium]|nr:hypothetical protein [Pseudobdellovibrionaceae bacterium]